MTPHNNQNGIIGTLTSWYDDIFSEKYAKEFALAVVIVALAAGSYYGYRWWTKNKDEAAHVLFAQNLEEFERMSQEGKAEDWVAIETLFKLGYDQYPKSSLAPYFLIYQSQAQLKQNKFDEALTTLDRAIAAMPGNSPVHGFYQTKAALMRLDSKNTDTHALGLEQLRAMTRDEKNLAYDVAAYHLGLYYWTNNDMVNAKEVWQKLIDATRSSEKPGQSPWAAQAQEKLTQIA